MYMLASFPGSPPCTCNYCVTFELVRNNCARGGSLGTRLCTCIHEQCRDIDWVTLIPALSHVYRELWFTVPSLYTVSSHSFNAPIQYCYGNRYNIPPGKKVLFTKFVHIHVCFKPSTPQRHLYMIHCTSVTHNSLGCVASEAETVLRLPHTQVMFISVRYMYLGVDVYM